MTPQEYLDSIGLGHLSIDADWWSNVTLAPRLTMRVHPPSEDEPAGMVWLREPGPTSFESTPVGIAEHLEHMASEAEAEAARYRAALAVLRGDAPQPVENKQ